MVTHVAPTIEPSAEALATRRMPPVTVTGPAKSFALLIVSMLVPPLNSSAQPLIRPEPAKVMLLRPSTMMRSGATMPTMLTVPVRTRSFA